MSRKVVLAGACRTAIGTMGGTLSSTPAVDLGAIVIKNALERAGVPASEVEHAKAKMLHARLLLRQAFQSKLLL